jgi:hypothetical protein
MNAAARILAVDKLNKGGNKQWHQGGGQSKILRHQVQHKLVAHLKSLRVDVNAMFQVAPPTSSARHVGAASVSVGDFVEVDADRTPGWNGEGGVAMVIAATS